jgi:hypothetical protein
MKAGFKRIESGMDIGVELGDEWEMAERLFSDTLTADIIFLKGRHAVCSSSVFWTLCNHLVTGGLDGIRIAGDATRWQEMRKNHKRVR